MSEIGQLGSRSALADSNFAFGERRFVRGFHLLGNPLVRLLRAFANQLAVPDEFVPPTIRILGFENHTDCLPLLCDSAEMYKNLYPNVMKMLNVSEFREQCLQLLDDLPGEGILITKRGRPVAKITPIPSSCSSLIGSVKHLAVNPRDDRFSTGVVWNAESGYSYSDQSA
jgi:antitoxin (DNA-binding transcriptional repressor) of toxin-antitoxin stability system